MKPSQIAELEEALGHSFSRPELLDQALTHASHVPETTVLEPRPARSANNEQLEYLGDSILGFVTTVELFHRFPQFHEGELTKLRQVSPPWQGRRKEWWEE
jgi:ribonuclease-3